MTNNKKAIPKQRQNQQNQKGKQLAKKDGFRYDYNDPSDFEEEK